MLDAKVVRGVLEGSDHYAVVVKIVLEANGSLVGKMEKREVK